MTCPHCKAGMVYFDHGICPKCKEYCGCSFNPVSNNDFCRHHLKESEVDLVEGKFPSAPCKYCGRGTTYGTCGTCHNLKSELLYFFSLTNDTKADKNIVLEMILRDAKIEQVQKKLDKEKIHGQ